jgi:hypothetical protein
MKIQKFLALVAMLFIASVFSSCAPYPQPRMVYRNGRWVTPVSRPCPPNGLPPYRIVTRLVPGPFGPVLMKQVVWLQQPRVIVQPRGPFSGPYLPVGGGPINPGMGMYGTPTTGPAGYYNMGNPCRTTIGAPWQANFNPLPYGSFYPVQRTLW